MGFSFKSNTNDTRESPAIFICKRLLEEGAILKIYDPKVSEEQIEKDLGSNNKIKTSQQENNSWSYSNSLYETFIDSDAAIFITEWEEFENLNWSKISPQMRQPAWVFDTRSILEIDEVKKSGVKIWQVGCVA